MLGSICVNIKTSKSDFLEKNLFCNILKLCISKYNIYFVTIAGIIHCKMRTNKNMYCFNMNMGKLR